MAASCQSTPVAKKELDSPEGMCRLAYLTAAHCVDSDFRTIEFLGIGEVQKSSMRISIPKEYSLSRAAQSREPQRGDSATIVFDVSCEKARSVVPVPLAPVDSQGTTIINSNRVYLQKRQGQAQGNRGEGAQILADVNGSDAAMYRFYAPSPQGYAIVGEIREDLYLMRRANSFVRFLDPNTKQSVKMDNSHDFPMVLPTKF